MSWMGIQNGRKINVIARVMREEQVAPASWQIVTVLVPPEGVAGVISAAERARRQRA